MSFYAATWAHSFKKLKKDLSSDLAMGYRTISRWLNLPNSGFPVKFNRNFWEASIPSRYRMVGDILSPR
jgi:hypothetical protein